MTNYFLVRSEKNKKGQNTINFILTEKLYIDYCLQHKIVMFLNFKEVFQEGKQKL